MVHTDLELSIRRLPDGAYAADLHAVLANADAELARDIPLALDQQALRDASLDPHAYGRLLRQMLFTPDLRAAWAQALGYHQRGSDPLRIRLRLDPADDALHGLHWETLYAPDAQAPLAMGERVLFSRYLGSPELADIQAPQRPDLKALVVVANPTDLEIFQLHPVDVDGEVRRARLALGDIPTTILAHAAGGERATLPKIAAALRDGPHILYLVCHGTLREGAPYLWLEQDDGRSARVAGSEFVQVIQGLGRRPLLIVLASCQSAGVLAAVGPGLARVGIAATVAMQGNISVRAVEQAMPVLFRELRRDGQIDRALAAARAALRDHPDWWVPVLFLRVRDGRLWREPAPIAAPLSLPATFVKPATALVGREELLATVRGRLMAEPGVRLALDGLPGAGKSRLAIELAFDPHIRWHFGGGLLVARLGQQPDLETDLRRWAGAFAPPVPLEPRMNIDEQIEQIVARVNRGAQPCLLIVDDLWLVEHARPLLIASPYISVLFTSRQRDQIRQLGNLIGEANLIAVPPLNAVQATDLLCREAGLVAQAEQPKLAALAGLVGGLPLMLTLMGAYLREHSGRADWFEQALRDLQNISKRLSLTSAPIEQARSSVSGGWFARFRRPSVPQALTPRVIIELSVAALPHDAQWAFIRLAAPLPDPVSFGLDTAQIVTERDGPALDDTLRLLAQRNLLALAGERFAMHRVLWDWAEDHDPRAVREARRRLHAWHNDLTGPEYEQEFAAWRAHADNWQQMLRTWEAAADDPDALRLCIQTIIPLLIEQGYWNAVLAGLERALELFQRVASERELVAWIRFNLGRTHYYRADYNTAEQYAEAALDDLLALNHQNGQAAVYSLLGMLDQAQGHYVSAQRNYQDALDRTSETDELNYTACLNNLAELLRDQGQYAEARPLLERALQIREQVLDPNHPNMASSLNNLSLVLAAQGQYAKARPLLERALQICEQVLGPTHPNMASSLNNLAELLRDQGQYAEARPLLERALQICEQVLGPTHPDTATSLDNLALVLAAQGQYAEARPLLERALQIREQVLGPTHPNTARSLGNRAALLKAQGQYAEARPLLERALQIHEQVLGPTHPDTATGLNNLAALLVDQGEYARARQLLERALHIREQVLGPTHPDTAHILQGLAVLLREQGERDDARTLLQRAVSIFDQALGAAHPDAQRCRQVLEALDDPAPSPGDPADGGDTNVEIV